MIPILDRNSFLNRFSDAWEPDQHISLIGPTGRGKTFTARQILERRHGTVIILAPKGVDKTLRGFGYHIKKWPPPFYVPGPNKSGNWLLRLEPRIKTPKDLAKVREEFAKALLRGFSKGSMTVYIDELQVTADPRMMGLGKLIEADLLMGRSRDLSIVSSIQVPRWAPRAAYDQASHVLMWRQRDLPSLRRIGEISGVDTRKVMNAVKELAFHEFLWVDAARDRLFKVGAQ